MIHVGAAKYPQFKTLDEIREGFKQDEINREDQIKMVREAANPFNYIPKKPDKPFEYTGTKVKWSVR